MATDLWALGSASTLLGHGYMARMDTKKTNVEPVEGQADELDRGTSNAQNESPDKRDEVVRDDEYERPPHDRSPLT